MKLEDQVKEHALACAKELTTVFSVGTSSQFCDAPPDWDPASNEEIAEIISEHFNRFLDVLS